MQRITSRNCPSAKIKTTKQQQQNKQQTNMTPNQLQKTNTVQSAIQISAKPKALEIMAAKLNVESGKMLETLKATVFKNATNEELVALVVVANEYGLNPFLKELYAFPAKGGGIVPVVSVDGWLKMINRQESFDGIDFTFENEDGAPYSCTANIYVKGRSRPTSVTEYYSECFRATEPWKMMPRRMLRHKAMIQCGRVAFGFSGVHDEDEAIDIASTVVMTAQEARRPRMVVDAQPQAEDSPSISALPEPSRELAADLIPPKSEELKTIHQYFQEYLDEIHISFDTFRKWGAESGNIPDAGSVASLDQCDGRTLRRLLNSKKGLAKALEGVAL